MNQEQIKKILDSLAKREISSEDAYDRLKNLPYQDLTFARLDHHRELRKKMPEVVFCPGKEAGQLVSIFQAMINHNHTVIGTKAEEEVYEHIQKEIPSLQYHRAGRVIYWQENRPPALGRVALVTAGTADIPIAEEAGICLELVGAEVNRYFDVGVAGIHRLLDQIKEINEARVVIVVAGMEGALASVLAGLTPRPVIAVPTSIGYGAGFHGIAALLTMLNSCAGGMGVVNIDNGYGAAALAFSILSNRSF